MIRAVLQMIETHSGLYSGRAQWTGQHWQQLIRIKTLKDLKDLFNEQADGQAY